MTLFHGNALARAGRGVLIQGKSGTGKSDLSLRLIDRGFDLVGDDHVHLSAEKGRLIARPDERICGALEVRGLGILSISYLPEAEICLIVTLAEQIERLPQAEKISLLGIDIPHLRVNPFEQSAPIKLDWALKDQSLIGRDRI